MAYIECQGCFASCAETDGYADGDGNLWYCNVCWSAYAEPEQKKVEYAEQEQEEEQYFEEEYVEPEQNEAQQEYAELEPEPEPPNPAPDKDPPADAAVVECEEEAKKDKLVIAHENINENVSEANVPISIFEKYANIEAAEAEEQKESANACEQVPQIMLPEIDLSAQRKRMVACSCIVIILLACAACVYFTNIITLPF